eukprot:UN30889
MNYNFNIAFNIKNKPGQELLNIKGEGYVVRTGLELENHVTGELIRLNSGSRGNTIDFGIIHIKETKRKKLIVVNESKKYPFDFRWKIPITNKYISIIPESGTVKKGERIPCELEFISEKETVLE